MSKYEMAMKNFELAGIGLRRDCVFFELDKETFTIAGVWTVKKSLTSNFGLPYICIRWALYEDRLIYDPQSNAMESVRIKQYLKKKAKAPHAESLYRLAGFDKTLEIQRSMRDIYNHHNSNKMCEVFELKQSLIDLIDGKMKKKDSVIKKALGFFLYKKD